MDADKTAPADCFSETIPKGPIFAYIASDAPIALETYGHGRAKRAIRDDVLVYVFRTQPSVSSMSGWIYIEGLS